MWKRLRKIIFALPPETAHALGGLVLKALGVLWILQRQKSVAPKENTVKNLSTKSPKFTLGTFSLDSPLGMAAGFDKNAEYLLGLRCLGFGFVEVGTVTPLPQLGNPKPRLFRAPGAEALINRMGFNSQGAETVARRLQNLRDHYRLDFPVGINLGKNRATPLEAAADDYVKAMELLYGLGDYLVVNLSSPNTPGLTSLQEGDGLKAILERVREAGDRLAGRSSGGARPLFLKVSPDLADETLLKAVDLAVSLNYGIIAANTTRRRDFAGISALEAAEEGGLSGRPLAARARELVPLLRKNMPQSSCLISVGGIFSAADVAERLDLGANLVQVYTGFIYAGPELPGQAKRLYSKALHSA